MTLGNLPLMVVAPFAVPRGPHGRGGDPDVALLAGLLPLCLVALGVVALDGPDTAPRRWLSVAGGVGVVGLGCQNAWLLSRLARGMSHAPGEARQVSFPVWNQSDFALAGLVAGTLTVMLYILRAGVLLERRRDALWR